MYGTTRVSKLYSFCNNYYLIIVVVVWVISVNGCFCARNRNRGHGIGNNSTTHVLEQHMRNQKHQLFQQPAILEKEADFLTKGKICIGTNGRMSVPSNREHHYRNLKDRYTNCTYVDGNLELTWLQDENFDLSFLQYIREVTGYVLISHVDIKRIVLPRLQIIRGRTLFKVSVRDEELALVVMLSKMYTLELPALRDILRGSVGYFNNYNLCHVKTINWKEIITDVDATHIYVYNFSSPERTCPPCHKDCKRGCWGEGKENCQQFSKEYCSPQCYQGRCFGPNPRECCHLFCAGGCTGPKQSDCIACRNFYDDGVCKQECPPMQRYNSVTYSWEPNPEGKYAYGATCVRKCPEHLLKDSGACVRTCPPTKKAVDGECVPCDGPCPKTCSIEKDVIIHSGNIDTFKDCTVIEGSIEILENSFQGFQHVFANYTFGERYPKMHPDRLQVFSTLKEVTGFVNIQAYHPGFKNLSYFRNLEVIGGRALYEYSASLYIVKTSLESLELRSLKKINMGTVAILENKHLCFAESINWTKIRRSKEHVLMLSNNSDPSTCKAKGLVCDNQCSTDGCWGAMPDQCLSCAHFKLAGQCLQNCSILPGIYRAEHNECRHCHEECGSFCVGPGANHCKSCKNFRDGPFCVPNCPANKFADSNNVCQHCSSTCVDGCTGSKNIVGPGGCNSCEFAILYENATTPVCLHKNDSCPERYFLEYVDPLNNDGQKPLEVKGVCRKCHKRCTKCSGFGFHTSVCKCASFKKGEQCEDECVFDHYPDITSHECIACDSQCRGCTGPGPENCITCQNFRIYDNNSVDVNKTFRCVAACGGEFRHRIVPEKGDPYCSEKPNIPIASARSQLYIFTTTACIIAGVLVILMVTAFVFYCQRKEKLKENAMKMTMALTGLEDNVPLRQSNVLPNFAKLRIIKETELRKGDELGHGAFGTVYKGYWVIDDPQPVGKIPVAIKVLRDGGANTSKEFLSEAYIMATVDHPNLLQLLAVCMTSKMMLITQLMPLGCLLDFVTKNKDRIGSKALLNWSTQIARGMAYLEEKRLVHRDLAARNVLVQSPAVVKITDFGLAKLLDTNEEEYKAEGGKMPIKWLALECIQHRIFTHKSDVWAFGVTVWELLTFGGKPYDKIPARNVPEILEKGERLPQPSIATIDVYVILIKCWMLDAESRPSFKELEDEFAKMTRDPGRYLVIPGDRFMRLHLSGTPQSDRDMVRSLASAMENSETSELDDYFQAKSRAPLHPSLSSTASSPLPDKFWPSNGHQVTSDGSASGFHNTQNHLNQRLLRYNQSDPSHRISQPDSNTLRYGRDSLKDIGSDEYDSGRAQAQVGPLKLELPFDEDDYLVPLPPSTQLPSAYLDVIDPHDHEGSLANVLRTYSDFYRNNIDNPEYLMSTDTTPCYQQTVGLPTVSELVHASTSEPSTPGLHKPFYIPQKSCEEESDHEYYNEIDRLQRELQPLHKSKHESAMV